MATTYEKIATTTLGAGAASISFTSIPGTYTDLRLVLVGTSPGNYPSIRYNNDSASNYSMTQIYGTGSSAASNRNTSQTEWYPNINAMSSTVPTMIEVDVFSYAGSTFKTGLATSSFDFNGSGSTVRSVGLYRSTTAITRLDIFALYGSPQEFNTGTTATLYGILKA
jgi:hypothetical protein